MSPGSFTRRATLRSVAAGAAVAATASVAPFAAGTADAAPGRSGGRPKPTIVLVHGAWADGSSWSEVLPRLLRDGYTVKAPPNPLRSLAGDAASIADFLSTVPGPVVLVGHSYGGAVITNAATGNPNVKALVFINAFVPEQGENVLQLTAAQPGSALAVADPTTVFSFVPYPNGPAGDVDLYLLPAVFANSFASDLPAHTSAVLGAAQRPLSFAAGGAASGTPAWKTIPSWYLVGTADKVIPPAEQRIMAKRAGARTFEVKASHLSMISHPEVATDVIEKAAGSVAG
jgi:pimeloyl-ACP methyl ester carboxylesterase